MPVIGQSISVCVSVCLASDRVSQDRDKRQGNSRHFRVEPNVTSVHVDLSSSQSHY